LDWHFSKFWHYGVRRHKSPRARPQLEALEHRLAPAVPGVNRVVVVVEENHAFEQVIGSTAAPYINSLASRGALMTNSFALTHPSQPNYLELFSGSTQGVVDDSCPYTFNAPNLASELLVRHRSFAGYSESLPAPGYLGCSAPGGYVRRHNPWADFTNVAPSANLPFAGYFPTDFTRLPTVSFVVPNLNDDMHDGTIQQADLWLQVHIAPYVRWAAGHNSLLIVTWDEDDGAHGNHIATIFFGPMVRPGRYGEFVSHAKVLRTIEAMYALPFVADTANVNPIADIWRTPIALSDAIEVVPLAAHFADVGSDPEPSLTADAKLAALGDADIDTLEMTVLGRHGHISDRHHPIDLFPLVRPRRAVDQLQRLVDQDFAGHFSQ
jgi:acid phosphatase